MKSASSQSSLKSSTSSKETSTSETEKASLESLPQEALLDRARILSLQSELRSLLQFRGKRAMRDQVPAGVTTPKSQSSDLANAGKTSSANSTPISTTASEELPPTAPSSASVRNPSPLPTGSTESLASSASVKMSLKPTTKGDSLHSEALTSPSALHNSPQTTQCQTDVSQSIPPSSKASIHSTVEEKEFCNDLLSSVLSEKRCLVRMMENLEWPDFLSLSQSCRGARRAVLEGYESGKDEGRVILGVGKNLLKRTGSHSSLSSQRSVNRVLMSAPVKEEILIAYVEGYRYLAGRIAHILSRRNAREAATPRFRSTRAAILNGRQSESIHYGRSSKNGVAKIQKPVEEINRVKVSLEDLQLLYLSSLTPLHAYPAHALVFLSGPSVSRPSLARRHSSSSIVAQTKFVEVTRKLQEMALAHSKFVLLLRNLADQLETLRTSELNPSSPVTPGDPPAESEIDLEREEEEDLFDVHAYIGGATSSSTLSRSPRGGLRELVFPAPLGGNGSHTTHTSTYHRSDARNISEHGQLIPDYVKKPSTPPSLQFHHSRSSTAPPSAFSRSKSSFSLSSFTSHTKASSLATARSSLDNDSFSPSKRLSFKRNKVAVSPPPLPSEPKTLKAYSNGWRRSLLVASESHRKRINRRSTFDVLRVTDEFGRGFNDEKSILEPPHKILTSSPPSNNSPLPMSSSGSDSSNTSSTSSSRRNSQDLSSGNSSPGSEKGEKGESEKGKEAQSTGRSSSVQFEEKVLRRMSALDKLNGARPRLGTTPSGRRGSLLPRSGLRVTKSNYPSSQATSPHDLVLATSTLRAPVLRVYVPCSDLSSSASEHVDKEGRGDYFSLRTNGLRAGGPGATPYTNGFPPPASRSPIQRVEAELMRAGVWKWMRGGEVVVNFGYMPGIFANRPAAQAPPKQRSRTLSPSRESLRFSNFTPTPGAGSNTGVHGNIVVRPSGRFTNGSGPSSGPPSAFRSPYSTPYGTPGPSRHSSATHLPTKQSAIFPNHSRQSTYDSFTTSSSAGPSRQSSYVVDSGRQGGGAKWLIFNGNYLVPYSPSPSEEALLDEAEGASKETVKSQESFLPLDDPFSLPSPFYYDHILGADGCLKVRVDAGSFPKVQKPNLIPELKKPHRSHTRSASDPLSTFGELGSYFREEFSNSGHGCSPEDSVDPLSPGSDVGLSMSLQTFPTLLRSPGSTSSMGGGWVTVRKWRWVAKASIPSTSDEETPSQDVPVPRMPPPTSFKLTTNASEYGKDRGKDPSKKLIGRGWLDKTWTLEGDGTKEGKDTLASCLKPSPHTSSAKLDWEIVRDRTTRAGGGKGVVWFRLLTPPPTSLARDGDSLTMEPLPTR
ncbi:hypothetical protein L218DRAFT_984757 [Marasmius fiardii PR-910]|nr:hypothetical protein L218DRAFT_984757 [Marasmius fiardii PR-910]